MKIINERRFIGIVVLFIIFLVSASNNLVGKEIKALLDGLIDENGKKFFVDSIKDISENGINILLANSSDCPPCVLELLKNALGKYQVHF